MANVNRSVKKKKKKVLPELLAALYLALSLAVGHHWCIFSVRTHSQSRNVNCWQLQIFSRCVRVCKLICNTCIFWAMLWEFAAHGLSNKWRCFLYLQVYYFFYLHVGFFCSMLSSLGHRIKQQAYLNEATTLPKNSDTIISNLSGSLN